MLAKIQHSSCCPALKAELSDWVTNLEFIRNKESSAQGGGGGATSTSGGVSSSGGGSAGAGAPDSDGSGGDQPKAPTTNQMHHDGLCYAVTE